jgi:uncharacterized UBP type Zn finger protein
MIKKSCKKSIYSKKLKKKEIDKKKIKMCKYFGLRNIYNSCYIDSVLMCLFAIPNSFITKSILKRDLCQLVLSNKKDISCDNNLLLDYNKRVVVQNELIRITLYMRGKEEMRNNVCSNLRKLISLCNPPEDFGGRNTQDAGEFLGFLFSVFNVSGTKRQIDTYISRDQNIKPKLSSTLNISSSPIQIISSQKILENKSENISMFIDNIEDSIVSDRGYLRKVEISSLLEASFLVFYAQRTYLTKNGIEKRTYNRIIPEQKIQNLILYAVVVHKDNHYTAFIKCDGDKWYYYDDLQNEIEYVGKYEDIFQTNVDPSKYGTLYFYK